MGSATGVEDALELPAPADSPAGWQSIGRHSGPFEFGRYAADIVWAAAGEP
jgi:allophanate hydrolase subunit 1